MSGKPETGERLRHIIDSIDRIDRFTTGMDFEAFLADEVVQFAVIKNFEIIGEAVYHLPPEFKKKHVDMEWRKMEAFRHVLVHDYFRINIEIVWRAKEEKLGDLKWRIDALLRDLDSFPGENDKPTK